MHLNLTPGRILSAAVVVLSLWIVHGFIESLLAAFVIAVASWPVYGWYTARLPRRLAGAGPVLFTCALTVFVLAPLVFACWALVGEANALLLGIAAADRQGLAVPGWLANAPVVGPWVAESWQSQLAHPGALLVLTQHTDPGALLGLAQSLGQFTARHALIGAFAVLLLGFLFQKGESLALAFTGALRRGIGAAADRYVDVATRAVRACVGSMLLVGLFDGIAAACAYAMAGAPRALVWGAITGSLAVVPFVGYAAVAALAVQLAVKGATTPALLSLLFGCVVLLCGDKVVRPMMARGGIRLPFVCVLMGCVGGFSTLGLSGLVIGPVALGLARELWDDRVRALDGVASR